MHLAGDFIQSDAQCIQAIHLVILVLSGNQTQDIGIASTVVPSAEQQEH